MWGDVFPTCGDIVWGYAEKCQFKLKTLPEKIGRVPGIA
jgi:hypothetical protein